MKLPGLTREVPARVGVVGAGQRSRERRAAWDRIGGVEVVVLGTDGDEAAIGLGEHAALGHGAGEAAAAGVRGAAVPAEVHRFLERVDLVDVCSPCSLAASVLRAAPVARRPTLCCWAPVATLGEAQEIAARYDEHGVRFVPDGLRLLPAFAAAARAVASGGIGTPAVLRLSTRSAPSEGPGAGSIMRDGVAPGLDYLRAVGGELETVHASVTQDGPGYVLAVLEHRNGAISHLEVSWADRPAPAYRSFELSGSDGLISSGSGDPTTIDLRLLARSAAPGPVIDAPLDASQADRGLRAALGVLAGTAEPVGSPSDWVEALRLALAAGESAARRGAVRVERQPSGAR